MKNFVRALIVRDFTKNMIVSFVNFQLLNSNKNSIGLQFNYLGLFALNHSKENIISEERHLHLFDWEINESLDELENVNAYLF